LARRSIASCLWLSACSMSLMIISRGGFGGGNTFQYPSRRTN
jgi:hypothetical protein